MTEEDILERLHYLQANEVQFEIELLKNLFHRLKRQNLLFAGCGFPDGLARFIHDTVHVFAWIAATLTVC